MGVSTKRLLTTIIISHLNRADVQYTSTPTEGIWDGRLQTTLMNTKST